MIYPGQEIQIDTAAEAALKKQQLTEEEYRAYLIQQLTEKEKVRLWRRAKRGLDDLYFLSREIIETDPERREMIVPHVHGEWSKWYHSSTKRLKMILVPRGTFKSTVFTVNNSLRKIAANPNERILIANAISTNARGFLREIKDHLEKNQEFKDNYGNFYDEKLMKTKYMWSEDRIEVLGRSPGVREPTVTAAGVETQLTSQHYSTIIWDDLVGEMNIGTREQALKVIEWWKRTLSLLDPLGEGIIVGTRWAHFELYHYIMEDPELRKLVDVFIRGAFNQDGSLYFPEMLSEEKLNEYKNIQGSYIFSAFYLNDPVDEETSLVKRHNIHTYGGTCIACNGEHKRPKLGKLAIFTACDPALSQASGADSSALITLGVDSDNRWWVLEVKSGRWTTDELLQNLFETYHSWHPETVTIETIGSAQLLIESIYEMERLLNVSLPLKPIKTRSGKSKDARIRAAIGPRFERNSVFCQADMTEFIDQLARYPRSRHDDIIDALSDISEVAYTPDTPLEEREEVMSEDKTRFERHMERLLGEQGSSGLAVDEHLGDLW